MTVSRALRRGEHVSRRLRERIVAIATELGYEHDPGLASFTAYRTRKRPRAEKQVLAYLTAGDTRDGSRKLAVAGQVFLERSRSPRSGTRLSRGPLWLQDLCRRHRSATDVLLCRGIHDIIITRTP